MRSDPFCLHPKELLRERYKKKYQLLFYIISSLLSHNLSFHLHLLHLFLFVGPSKLLCINTDLAVVPGLMHDFRIFYSTQFL
uniref:Uncharacterized protein n=1 Tax=Anguilla anguilla TaxID=7936 RepID=A0A0E9U2S7_ANGAN